MEDKAKKMIAEGSLCVLSSCSEDIPNSSLMQYISDETADKIYMITLKDSTKYRNISQNPRVSLLIDTRDQLTSDTERIRSLIVYGTAKILEDQAAKIDILKRLVEKHRNLIPLSEKSDCQVIQVRVERLLLLDGVDEGHYVDV